jgi:hypothetical protein
LFDHLVRKHYQADAGARHWTKVWPSVGIIVEAFRAHARRQKVCGR